MAPGEHSLKTVNVISLCSKPSNEGEGMDQLRLSSYSSFHVRLPDGGGSYEVVMPSRWESQRRWEAC